MTLMYLRPVGDAAHYTDLANYSVDEPFTAPTGFEWVEGSPPDDAVVFDPKAILTAAVLALPASKQTDKDWGVFINQCLLAIRYEQMDALAELVNGFQTTDADYLGILDQAKTLYGITGGS